MDLQKWKSTLAEALESLAPSYRDGEPIPLHEILRTLVRIRNTEMCEEIDALNDKKSRQSITPEEEMLMTYLQALQEKWNKGT